MTDTFEAIVFALAASDPYEKIERRGDWHWRCRYCESEYSNGGTLFTTQVQEEVDHFPACLWVRAVQTARESAERVTENREGFARRDAPTTSRRAAKRIAPRSGTQRARALHAIIDAPDGLTDDELELVTGLAHQTVSARRRELVIDGFITARGERKTRRRSDAQVWYPTEAGVLWGLTEK